MKEVMNKITQQTLIDSGKKGFTMPQTKIDGFFKHFPWLKRLGGYDSDVGQVYVSRVTPELLDYVPINITRAIGFDVDEYWNEYVHFVDGAGKQVNVEYIHRYTSRKYVFFGPMIKHESKDIALGEIHGGESTIRGCLFNTIGTRADDVRYIVSYFSFTKAIIVYKVPNGVTLPVWIKQQIEAEKASFKKECAEIDAEAVTV